LADRSLADELDGRLDRHLENWLGTWPGTGELVVTSSRFRELPGWDGKVRPVAGVSTGERRVISVPAALSPAARELAEQGRLESDLGALVGLPGHRLGSVVFRYCRELVAHEPIGEWCSPFDERLPAWLSPFNGEVLACFDGDGRYMAGVGRKMHDAYCQEIAVGTDERHRNKGLAKRLVATAVRRIVDEGGVPTYLHAADNYASARVAQAVGFPDLGWHMIGLWPPANDRQTS
jgi:GNAT superfamily N-acetyltransferase